MAIDINSEPVMSLTALPKPSNRTRFHRRYKRNPLGIKINDTVLSLSLRTKCVWLSPMSSNPLKRLSNSRRRQQRTTYWTWQGSLLAFLSATHLLDLIRPHAITAQSVNRYTGRKTGTKCKLDMFFSSYHFSGGNAHIVDESYKVKGIEGFVYFRCQYFTSFGTGCPIVDHYAGGHEGC